MKNIFQLFFPTVATSYLKYTLADLHSTCSLFHTLLLFLTTINKVSGDTL